MPYSTQLFAVLEDLSAGPPLYTVPSGYVLVLRDVSVRNRTGDTSVVQVGGTVPGPLNVLVMQWDSVASGDVVEWQGRAVFNAGDSVFVYNEAGEAQALGSGYLLAAP